jgi:hypothetical protein
LGKVSSRRGCVAGCLLIAKPDVSDPFRLRNPCQIGDWDSNHPINRRHPVHPEGFDYQVVPIGHLGCALYVGHVWCLFSIRRQRGQRETDGVEPLAEVQPDRIRAA